MFNHDIDLGKSIETIVKNEVIKSINWTYRLANKLDDNMSEFYKAAAVGLKPEFTFETNDFEYENANYLR